MCEQLQALRRSFATYAAHFDAESLTPEQASKAVPLFAQIEASAASMKALAAARAATGNSWRREGFRSPADQLARQAGMSPSGAKRALETGKRLATQPDVAAAALAGELSAEQAAAVADGVEANPSKSGELVQQARSTSLPELNEQVARIKAAAADPDERRRRIHRARHLRRWTDRDGTLQAHLSGHVEDGVRLWRVLDPIRRRLAALRQDAETRDPFDALDYDALIALAGVAIGRDGEVGLADLLELGLFPQFRAGETRERPPGPAAASARDTTPQTGTSPAGRAAECGGAPRADPETATSPVDMMPVKTAGSAGSVSKPAARSAAAVTDSTVPPRAASTEPACGPTGRSAGNETTVTPDANSATGEPAVAPAGTLATPSATVADDSEAEPAAGLGASLPAKPGLAAAATPARQPGPLRPSRRRMVGSPTKLMIRVDLDSLLRGVAIEGELSEIAGFGPVPVSVIKELAAQENLFVVGVLTKGSQLVGIYHHGRRPNAHQSSALDFLYPSCAVAGCTARAGLQYDHREDWARTRFTVFDLLDRLCPHHHRLKTEEGWALVGGTGKRAFVAPGDPRHPGVDRPRRLGTTTTTRTGTGAAMRPSRPRARRRAPGDDGGAASTRRRDPPP
jgi:hypothetical protein